MIPIFSSHYSIGRSILTLDEAEKEIDFNAPISIFTIAKVHNLKEIYLCDTKFGGFFEAYKNSNKVQIPLRYGIKFNVCDNVEDKTEDSLKTESKINIWIKNSAGYGDLCKIYSKSYKDGFYYHNRIDWKTLHEMWTDNLILTIPFYDSFLHKNLLKFEYRAVPNFGSIKPTFFLENKGLPFDDLIAGAVNKFADSFQHKKLAVHTVYYYSAERNFKSYLTFRTIHERTKFDNPNLEHFSSTRFDFLSLCS